MSYIFDHLKEIFSGSHPSVVIEVGAHVGGDTEQIWEAAGGDSCRYFAFEPDPRNASQFRVNHSSRPITFIQAAVSDRNGVSLYRGSHPYTGSGSIKVPKHHLEAFPDVEFPKQLQVNVPTVTLDEIVSVFAIPRIDFIWCDVQGAEDLVIAGGQCALEKTRWLFSEFYDEPMYEGQLPLSEMHKRLPGEWDLVQRWKNDALFRNKKFACAQ